MSGERSRTVFFCGDCGNESRKWMGFCPACGSKAPLTEAPRNGPATPSRGRPAFHQPAELEELSAIEPNRHPRISVGIGEMDRVLGGGIVPGSAVLMAGEPGVGKSTLLLQTAGLAANRGLKVVYVSGEESAQQIKVRSTRLGIHGGGVFLLSETDVDLVIEHLDRSEASLVVVDSIQTMHAGDIQSGPGSVAQVRECALRLIRWCKDKTVPLIMSGHVTKDGALAGPRALEHMVDVSLHMEGENATSYRILRGEKNRFGSTDEVGIFQMDRAGLSGSRGPIQSAACPQAKRLRWVFHSSCNRREPSSAGGDSIPHLTVRSPGAPQSHQWDGLQPAADVIGGFEPAGRAEPGRPGHHR